MSKEELKEYYIKKCEKITNPVISVFLGIDTDKITTTEQIDELING